MESSTGFIGRYRVEGLGDDSPVVAAEAYRAYDELLQRWVTLRPVLTEQIVNRDAFEQLQRMVQRAAAVDHPAVAEIFDILLADGCSYLVTEHVQGESLASLLHRGPARLLPRHRRLQLALAVAGGLQAAHREGIVHGDLQLANVVVTPDGRAKLLGLAEPAAVGSAEADREPTHDLRSLGQLLGELLAGCGTPPPQVASGLSRLEEAADGALDEVVESLTEWLHEEEGRQARRAVLRRSATIAALIAIVVGLTGWLVMKLRTPPEPLYVAVLRPRIDVEQPPEYLETVAAGVRVAATNLLASLDGVYVLRSDEVDASTGDAREVAKTAGANEVLELVVSESEAACNVALRRMDGATGEDSWSDVFEAPVDNLQLLFETVGAHLQLGYMDRKPRAASHQPQARPEDYQELLDVSRALFRDYASPATVFRRLRDLRTAAPDLIDAYHLEILTAGYLFEADLDQGIIDQAEESLQQAKSRAPDDPRILLAEADLAIRIHEFKRAEKVLERLHTVAPGHPYLLRCRARLAEKRGDYLESVELMEEEVRLRHSAWSLLELASAETKAVQVCEARKTLEKALALAPNNLAVHVGFAEWELNHGSIERAEEVYKKIVRVSPRAHYYSNLAICRLLLGDYKQAVDSYERILAGNPRHPTRLLNLGECYVLAGRRKDGLDCFRKALALLEGSDISGGAKELGQQAQCLAHLGRRSEALARLREAQQLDPDSSEIAFSTSLVLVLFGDLDAAEENVERALELGQAPLWYSLPWFDALRERPEFTEALEAATHRCSTDVSPET